jgi:DNA-binding response OmpR family regulator
MVVDSQPGTLQLIALMLQRGGFEAVKMENPDLALGMLKTFSPDLFIIDADLTTPGMDGIELCRQVRMRLQCVETPIIVLSKPGDMRAVEEAMLAGATDYLPKPILHYDLLAKVRHALGLEEGVRSRSAIGMPGGRTDARAW